MKTRLLLLFLNLFSVSSFAAVISVVNGDNLQTKINNATAGDVLVVGPGSYNANSDIILTKKLTILGPGYFKTEGTAYIYQLKCNGGSEGSYISGLEVQYDAFIAANNVTFIRNLVNRSVYLGYNGSSFNTSNSRILQNYIMGQNNNGNASIFVGYSTSNIQSNFTISNNICLTNIFFYMHNSSTGTISNNVFDPDSTNLGTSGNGTYIGIQPGGGISNVSFYNNIFKGGFLHTTSSDAYTIFSSNSGYPDTHPLNFKYNIYDILPSGYTIPADNLLTTAKIFGGYPTNTLGLNNADGRAILAPGSPAANYGRKAPYASNSPVTDAGVFGGDQPYVLSGIPVGPQIYSMSVPPLAAANSVIPVTVKAKTNN